MFLVLRDDLAHLILLNLIDIVLLVAVWVHFEAVRYIDSRLGQSALAHRLQLLLIEILEVRLGGHGPLPQALYKSTIFMIRIGLKLIRNLNQLLRRLIVVPDLLGFHCVSKGFRHSVTLRENILRIKLRFRRSPTKFALRSL